MDKKHIIILLFIIISILISIYIYENYTNPKKPKKSNQKISFNVVEDSCKFSEKSYNDKRKIHLITPQNIHEYNIEPVLLQFLEKNKQNKISRVGYGYDKETDVSKIYLGTHNENIYGIEKQNNKYFKRFYKPINIFKKQQLDELVGKEKSDKFYEIFYIDDILDDFNASAYSKHEEYNNYEINAYHIFVGHYNINIGDYGSKIKQINEHFNFNNDNIDIWINKNKDNYIYWVGFTINNKKKCEITYYYRNKKHNNKL